MTIRVMLVDDHRMFREALRISLEAESDIQVVAAVGSGEDALAALAGSWPDVLVLDIAMPGIGGVETACRVLLDSPSIRIVTLSGYVDRIFVSEMLKAGARAYVVKTAGTEELVRAIRAVVAGQVFLSPEVTALALGNGGAAGADAPLSVLRPREKEVLRLLATGMRSAEISAQLGIATDTVKVHRRNIKHKIGLSSTAELTRYAIREGLLAL